MKPFSKIKIRLTALCITIVGLALSYRQARAAFPLLPLAGLGGLPFLSKGLGSIGDFKKMAEVALESLLIIKYEIEIVGTVFLVVVLIYAIARLIIERRRNKVKRIIAHLSGMYAVMSLLKEGEVDGPEKRECELSLQELISQILLLFEYKFLKRHLRMPSYMLVRSSFEKMKDNNKVTSGQIAMVSQYLGIFETMSRW